LYSSFADKPSKNGRYCEQTVWLRTKKTGCVVN
jgi:hypothetical protein